MTDTIKRTNEELAQLIQNGRKDLIPELWENVKRLLYLKSRRYYILKKERFDNCGIVLEDIEQSCYFVFLEALNAYDSSEGFKFTTYFQYPFQTVINELLGSRTERQYNEPINNAASLDSSISENNDGDVLTLLETIADNTSLDFIDNMELASVGETVRAVVDRLPEPYRTIIRRHYFENATLKVISEEIGYSYTYTHELHYKSMRILRDNEILHELYYDMKKQERKQSYSRFQYSPEYFELIRNLEKKPLSYGKMTAALYEAQLKWEAQNSVRL